MKTIETFVDSKVENLNDSLVDRSVQQEIALERILESVDGKCPCCGACDLIGLGAEADYVPQELIFVVSCPVCGHELGYEDEVTE